MKTKVRKILLLFASAILIFCVYFCVAFGYEPSKAEDNSSDDYKDIFGYSLSDLAMYIDEAGTYTLSGNYSGMIYVDVSSSDEVILVLNNASVTNTDGPAIYVANSGSCILKIAEGSENTVTSGTEIKLSSKNINANAQYGAITFKDDAKILGSGSLSVFGYINNGIHCSNNLIIENGNISITAINNAIKGNDSISVSGGTISASCCGKGIVSDVSINISGGDISVSSVDDAIHSNDSIYIKKGTLSLGSYDDGIHADNALTIDNGEITIYTSYEGIEANQITINDGNISVTATDDGMNAYGGNSSFGMGGMGSMPGSGTQSDDDTFSSATPNLIISGGTIFVDAAGDGLDSNGNLIVNDGYIIVEGPTNSANGSLDSGTENGGSLLVNGGTLLAIGASGMAETPESSSTQCYISLNASYSAGDTITLSSGNEILFTYTPTKTGSSIVLSSSYLKKGSSYTISVGSSSYDFTVSSIATTVSSGGGGGTNRNTPGTPGGGGGGRTWGH